MSKAAFLTKQCVFLWLLLLAFPARTAIPKPGQPRSLKEVVLHRAQAIKDLGQSEIITLGEGRLSLLHEMLGAPGQLGNDIPRLAQIWVGQTMLPAALRSNKSAEFQFMHLGTLLRNYIKQSQPELINSELPGRVGAFWIAEVVYAIVQNFSAPALELAHQNTLLNNGEWATPAQSAKQYAIFKMEASREPILSVTFTCERTMSNVKNANEVDKNLVTESSIYFYLQSGQVTFGFKYMLDGRGSMRVCKTIPKSMVH